jgi:glycosyltransferase involved in cell wall biosynthesis
VIYVRHSVISGVLNFPRNDGKLHIPHSMKPFIHSGSRSPDLMSNGPSLNVLFVHHQDFTAGSGAQVFALANQLEKLGCDCVVTVPNNKQTVRALGEAHFRAIEFEELRKQGLRFRDGRGPDVVHAWTPREIVRRFCLELKRQYSFAQFVHLDDNECYITAKMLGRKVAELQTMPVSDLDQLIPANLSHPNRAATFLQEASGITLMIDRLRELAPASVPAIELWPSVDSDLFSSRPIDTALRSKYRIALNSTVLAYAGDVHATNADEVRSLYLAVAILNREGHPTTLVRAGRDTCPFLGPDDSWARLHSIDLGYVPHNQIPEVLSLADILVQPGAPSEFNDYRFPRKVPEYLAIGRPVVLPRTNIGLNMHHLRDAYVLPKLDALAIVDAVRVISADAVLYKQLASGARAFSDQRLSWSASARSLFDFYHVIVHATLSQPNKPNEPWPSATRALHAVT